MSKEVSDTPSPKNRGPLRRILRVFVVILKTCVRIIEGVLLLAVLVIGFIHTQPGRNLVASIVESKVGAAIQGDVSIGRLRSVSLFGIVIEDVVLLDPEGRPVLEIEEFSADWNLLDIIAGEINVERVAVVNPQVGLWLDDDGQFSLFSAIASTAPATEPSQPDETGGEPTPIRVRHFSLSGGSILTDDPRVRDLSVAGLEILASLTIESELSVDLDHFALGVENGDGRLLEMWFTAAVLQVGETMSAQASLVLASSGDVIATDLTFQTNTDEEPFVTAHVELAPITGLLLEPLGFADLQSSIPEWIRGQIDATGPLSELDVLVDLDTPGGPIHLTATVTDLEDIELSTNSDGLELQAVASMLPDHDVSWDLDIEVDTDDEGQRTILLELAEASFDDLDIPAVTIRATLNEQGVSVEQLSLPHLGDQLEISGSYEFGGEIEADIRIDDLDLGGEPRLESLLQGATGIVDATVHAQLDPADRRIEADVNLALEQLHGFGVDVGSLTVSGSAHGPLLSPEVDLDINIERLLAGSNGVDRANIHLIGPVGQYDLDGEVQITGGPLVTLGVVATIEDDDYEVNGTVGASMDGETISLLLDGVEFSDGEVFRVRQLSVTHTSAQVLVSGTYELDGQVALLVDIPRFDLGILDGRLVLPDLPVDGDVVARIELSGELTRPNVDLALSWDDGELASLSDASASIVVALSGRDFSSRGDLDLGDDLTAHWDAHSTLPRGDDLVAGFLGADWDLTLNASSPSLVWLEDLIGELPILSETSAGSDDSLLSDSSFAVEVSLNGRRFNSTGDVHVGSDLNARWDANSVLSSGNDVVEGLLGADWDVGLDVNADSMEWLGDFGDALPAVADSFTTSITVSGTLDEPELSAVLDVFNLEADALSGVPVDLSTRIEVGLARSTVDLQVTGMDGQLLSLEASAQLGSQDLIGGSFDPMGVLDGDWQLELRAPRRDVTDIGLALGPLADYPVEIEVDISLQHDASAPVTGWLLANAEIDLSDAVESSDGCTLQDRLTAAVEVELARDSSDLQVTAFLEDRQLIHLGAQTDSVLTVISELMDGSFPVINAEMMVDQLGFERIPLVCDAAAGTLTADLNVTDFFGTDPHVDLRLEGSEISIDGADPFDLATTLTLSTAALDVAMWVSAGESGVIELAALAPLRWDGDPSLPGFPEESLVVTASIVDFPIRPLAPFVDPLRRGVGHLNGHIAVEGPLDALVPNGEIVLEGLEVIVPGLEQRLTDVNGAIRISSDRITIQNLTAVDRDGTITVNGHISIVDLTPTGAQITFEAVEFPMRQAGSEVAQLTVVGEVTATLTPETRRIDVMLREITVWLADESAGGVQSLEANPDVILVDAAGLAEAEEINEVAEATSAVPLHIVVDASSPFWVRKTDLAVQLSTQLEVDIDDTGTRISGTVDVRRGTVALMSKEFSLQPGSIIFDGGQQLDPLLDLVAVHELSRYPGETVSVIITGRLSRPQLSFDCTLEGVSTETEIVQLLATGRVAGDEADSDIGDQVASMLSGITAGVLMVAARNALGDAMPVISVETGADLSDVQIRAGFVVDSLIPDFLEGIVTGMYVEGVFDAGGEEDGAAANRSAFGGFLLELYFDNGWLTSSSFRPPANWSIDVLWRP